MAEGNMNANLSASKEIEKNDAALKTLTPPRDIRFIEQKDCVECRLKSFPIKSVFMIPFSIFWMGLIFKMCSISYHNHPSDFKILTIVWLIFSSPGFIVFLIGLGFLFNHQSLFINNDRISYLKRSLPWPSRIHLLLKGLTNVQCKIQTYRRSSQRREQRSGTEFGCVFYARQDARRSGEYADWLETYAKLETWETMRNGVTYVP